jgi:glycosyltransferase involved in cell wall biosynthesis
VALLIKNLAKNQYDVIYVIGFRAAILVRLFCVFFRNTKIVQGIRWNPNTKSVRDVVFRCCERFLSILIDKYISNSIVAAKNLCEYLKIDFSRCEVVYNGVDIKSNAVFPRKIKIVTVANLSPRKGCLEYLVQVVAVICKEFREIEFVFIGRDDMAGALKSKSDELGLSGCVRFTGFVSDVVSELEDSLAFVLPSRYGEGCPTSILEAMACGLPIIAFEIDGIPELIEDNKSGFLIKNDDYVGMFKTLKMLIQNPELAKSVGSYGNRKVREKFSIYECSRRHAQIFRDL